MEINYDELFGVESAKTEDVAETPAEESADTAEESAGAKESEPAEQTEQSKEDNAKYAAIRRKAEADADAKVQKMVDDAFAASGLTNPFTGKPILSKADFEEYSKAINKEKVDGILDKTGMSEEEFQRMVNDLPDVKAARQAKEDLDRQKQQMVMDAQIAEVTKMNPDIKTVNDVLKLDKYPEIYAYVRKGITIPEAYKLVYFDDISGKTASAAKQAAINAKAGKEHLAPTTSRGEGAQSVPADVAEMYRAFNPKATDAEIQAHYNKHHKKG